MGGINDIHFGGVVCTDYQRIKLIGHDSSEFLQLLYGLLATGKAGTHITGSALQEQESLTGMTLFQCAHGNAGVFTGEKGGITIQHSGVAVVGTQGDNPLSLIIDTQCMGENAVGFPMTDATFSHALEGFAGQRAGQLSFRGLHGKNGFLQATVKEL